MVSLNGEGPDLFQAPRARFAPPCLRRPEGTLRRRERSSRPDASANAQRARSKHNNKTSASPQSRWLPPSPSMTGPPIAEGGRHFAARTFERALENASITSGKGAKSPEKRRPGRVSGPAEGECTTGENGRTTTSSTKRINCPREDVTIDRHRSAKMCRNVSLAGEGPGGGDVVVSRR